jgi:hypothetical protein
MARARTQISPSQTSESDVEELEELPLVTAPITPAGTSEETPENVAPMPEFPATTDTRKTRVRMRQFELTAECRIVIGGCAYTLPKGKIVDGANYDLDSLRKQGCQLAEI